MPTTQFHRPALPLRRRLLLGVPGGLALASPLALLGCGGGVSGGEGQPTSDNVVVPQGPPGSAVATATPTAVQAPPGLLLPAGGLTVSSMLGTSAVNGGTASVLVVEGGPQLAVVQAGDGTPILLGWAGRGQLPLSALSTATVLLHFVLGLPYFAPAVRDELRRRLADHAATAILADKFTAALVADRRVLQVMPPALLQALQQAAEALLPAQAERSAAGRKQALGLVVQPAGERSGIAVDQGDTFNSIAIANSFMRRGVVFVNREASVFADGRRVEEPSPVQVGEAIVLAVPAAFDSVSSTVSGWANEYFSEEGQGNFFRAVTDPLTLAVTPDGARRTEYSVVALMAWGQSMADRARFDRLPAAQRAAITGVDLDRNVVLQTVLMDLLGPLLFGIVAERLGEFASNRTASGAREDLMKSIAATLLQVLNTRVPQLIERVSSGAISPYAAFAEILRAFVVDPNSGGLSPLASELLTKLAEALASSLADISLQRAAMQIATDVNNPAVRNRVPLFPVLRALGTVDQALGYLAVARVGLDMQRSRPMEEWQVVATQAKVRLRPDPFEVDPQGTFVPIRAEVVDNDNNPYGVESGSVRYDWECSARYGTLYKRGPGSETNRFSTSAVNATCDYQPSGQDPGDELETITVRAYVEPPGTSSPPEFLGEATVTVRFKKAFSLEIAPASAEIPTDRRLGIVASVREQLPEGTTVEWTFSKSGVGNLTAEPPDGRPAQAEARFSSADEGTATVTARAQVNVPASATSRAYSVLTNPITASLRVRRGVRTVEVNGTLVFEIQPSSSGFSDGAVYVVVPKIEGAAGYAVRISGLDRHPSFPGGTTTRNFAPAQAQPGLGQIGNSLVRDMGGTYWFATSSGSACTACFDANIAAAWRVWFASAAVTAVVTLE